MHFHYDYGSYRLIVKKTMVAGEVGRVNVSVSALLLSLLSFQYIDKLGLYLNRQYIPSLMNGASLMYLAP